MRSSSRWRRMRCMAAASPAAQIRVPGRVGCGDGGDEGVAGGAPAGRSYQSTVAAGCFGSSRRAAGSATSTITCTGRSAGSTSRSSLMAGIATRRRRAGSRSLRRRPDSPGRAPRSPPCRRAGRPGPRPRRHRPRGPRFPGRVPEWSSRAAAASGSGSSAGCRRKETRPCQVGMTNSLPPPEGVGAERWRPAGRGRARRGPARRRSHGRGGGQGGDAGDGDPPGFGGSRLTRAGGGVALMPGK